MTSIHANEHLPYLTNDEADALYREAAAEHGLPDEHPAETQGETEDPWEDVRPEDTGWPTAYEYALAGRTE